MPQEASTDRLGVDAQSWMRKVTEGRPKCCASLASPNDWHSKLFEIAPDALFVHADWRILEANPATLRLFRANASEQLIGRDILDFVAPGSHKAMRERLRDLYEAERIVPSTELELQQLDGTSFWAHLSGASIGHAGRFAVQEVVRDVTDRKNAERTSLADATRFHCMAELSPDWYWEQDAQLRFTYISSGFAARSGADPAKVLGRRRWECEDVVPASGIWEDHRAELEARRPFRNFTQIRVFDDGTRAFLASSGEPVYDESGQYVGYRGVGRDVTARRGTEKALERLARFDATTSLPNRTLVLERLEQIIAQSRRHHRTAGVLLIDLDHFKLINDTLGHQLGDMLLDQVGRSLKDCVRREDTVGRLSGDEFVVVLADLSWPDDAAFVARKILDSFTAPFDLEGRETFITASVGVAAFPHDCNGAEALLQCAEAAMYQVKEASRNSYRFYTAEINARAAARLQLNGELRRAVERSEFELHYQPKVLLDTGEMVGLEALLRWRHPERGLVSPIEFIRALEDMGLIMEVGDWVIGEACRQLREWINDGMAPLPVAVNLSAKQFRKRDLFESISGQLRKHRIGGDLLELEVTESSLMDDPEDAVRQLRALRDAGLRVSVDDFGTGYSSLAYLARFPVSTLKIDRSFVDAALTDANAAAIVKLVIDMAQNLNFEVIAEGIETQKHVAFLHQHGCQLGQGFLFGRPMPAAEISQRLRALREKGA